MPRASSQTIQFTRLSSNKNPENEKLPVQLNAGNSHKLPQGVYGVCELGFLKHANKCSEYVRVFY